jgi:leucyl aminopeptidase|tara:strand:- start:3132 stop:4541 length:1410 start_codon:yes stop_codon:yes gene_type:complete
MSSYEPKSAVVVLYDSKEYKSLDKKTGGLLSSICGLKNIDSKDNGEVTITFPSKINVDAITVIKTDAVTTNDWRNFGGKIAKQNKGNVANLYFDINNDYNESIYEGAMLTLYNFEKYKSKKDTDPLNIHIDAVEEVSLHTSIAFARDVITEPGNVLYPASYAQTINDTLSPLGVNVRVFHESQLETMGFDLLLSVGQGSRKDSYVVVMEWMGGDDEQPIALVGKGVTFDTGGISIKPSAGMGDMKYDMGGSGAVVGAMHAIASQDISRNVVGIVGLVENMPDGNAIKPGDVVTSLSGQTVENLNTDAEGRLVLADILTYVQKEYDPNRIIDLATLTGAILVSLGNEMAGLFTNSTDFGKDIVVSGKAAGEGYWRMPMGENWNKMIDSPIADMKNISSGRGGGSTTAAEFLYRFVDNHRNWAHLDIAGMAWNEKGNDTNPGGAVGFGVRTLFEMVQKSVDTRPVDTDMKY